MEFHQLVIEGARQALKALGGWWARRSISSKDQRDLRLSLIDDAESFPSNPKHPLRLHLKYEAAWGPVPANLRIDAMMRNRIKATKDNIERLTWLSDYVTYSVLLDTFVLLERWTSARLLRGKRINLFSYFLIGIPGLIVSIGDQPMNLSVRLFLGVPMVTVALYFMRRAVMMGQASAFVAAHAV